MFGRIAAGTNEKLFGPALVLLRISFGLILAKCAADIMFIDGTNYGDGYTLFPAEMLQVLGTHLSAVDWISLILGIVSVLFIAGLLTKPASIVLFVLLAVIDVALLPISTVKALLIPELFAVSVLLMALSGGIGNALGLNGLILRNIKSPGAFLKFLFS